MILQLLLALLLTCMTVVVHVVGTVRIVLPLSTIWRIKDENRGAPRPIVPLIRLVSGLLLLHLFEMSVWAAAFTAASVLPDFETSLYYSLKSYTTVGYGDILPPVTWRLVGPIEAAVGVLMLGLSTGILVAAVQRLYSGRFENS